MSKIEMNLYKKWSYITMAYMISIRGRVSREMMYELLSIVHRRAWVATYISKRRTILVLHTHEPISDIMVQGRTFHVEVVNEKNNPVLF